MREIRPSGLEGGVRLIPHPYPYRPFLASGTTVASVLLRCDADEALLGRTKDGEWNGDRLQRAVARYARIGPPVADHEVRPVEDAVVEAGLREELELEVRADGLRVEQSDG